MHLKILLCSILLIAGVIAQDANGNGKDDQNKDTTSGKDNGGDGAAAGAGADAGGGGGGGDAGGTGGGGDAGGGGAPAGGGGAPAGGGGAGDGGGGGGAAAGGGAPPSRDTKEEKRKDVEIPAAQLDVNVPAVLVQSKDVPSFEKYDNVFSTIYPMTCGTAVKALRNVEGIARCMPDTNDILEIRRDDDLYAEFCMRVMVCKPGQGSQMCEPDSIKIWFPYGKKLVEANSVKDHTDGFLKVTKGEIVLNVDPGCMLRLDYEHGLRHRFQNKPPKIREIMKKYPGFYLQPSFVHPRRLYRGGNTIFLGKAMQLGQETYKMIECNAGCDEGQLFYYKMNPNFPFYSKIFVDAAICEWFKVCIAGQQGVLKEKYYCRDADMVNVYIRNGFVVMPGAQNGATIRLVKSTKTTSAADAMKSRPTQIGFDYDGERFSIWSVGRERVASSSKVNHDGHIILYFSDHNCLIKKYGIMYLGENNGKVFQVSKDKSIDKVSKEKGSFVTYTPAASRPTLGTLATETPTPNASAVAPITTTPERNIGQVIDLGKAGHKPKKARTGWLIWAIFFGFLVGSIISVIIGGLLLYFARRTAYVDWYRGMYKRYGCDASGVTGGVTGSQFGGTTTGGNTMSTIGSTTAGTTGTTGSTMGTTGGGSTMGTTGRSTGGGSTMGTTGDGGTTGGTSGGDMVTM